MLNPDTFALHTERLLIRAFTPDDVPAVFRVSHDAFGVTNESSTRDYVLNTLARLKIAHQLTQPPYGDFAVCTQAGDLIGTAGYVPSYGPFGLLSTFGEDDERTVNLSTPEWGMFWALRNDARGQGYATEAARALIAYAFDQFALMRVVATTEYDNAASIAVMRRLGMVVERNPRKTPEWFQVVGVLQNPRAA